MGKAKNPEEVPKAVTALVERIAKGLGRADDVEVVDVKSRALLVRVSGQEMMVGVSVVGR